MQQDPENHFDDSIRNKLREEEYYPVPAYAEWASKGTGSMYGWLRGFFFSDLLLLLLSSILAFNTTLSGQSVTDISNNAEYTSQKNIEVGKEETNKAAEIASGQSSTNPNNIETESGTSLNSNSILQTTSINQAFHGSNFPTSQNSPVAQNSFAGNGPGSESQLDHPVKNAEVYAYYASATKANEAQSSALRNQFADPAFNSDNESAVIDFLQPLSFKSNSLPVDYSVQSREFQRTSTKYRKPFTLDVLVLAEKTMGYNKVYPQVYQLNLNLIPKDYGYGFGLLFNYRIADHIGIKTGIETVMRDYVLSYNYTRTTEVLQPDGTFKSVLEILTNKRSVSETEVRIPVQLTYALRMDKWIIEPALGITIKAKNLNVKTFGSDQIPAALLSSIDVSNNHLVTSGWMASTLIGYQFSEKSIAYVSPYYQSETFGKSSRQYYTGRAVSGAGVKAGLRFMFTRND